jgi:hypothetical protein
MAIYSIQATTSQTPDPGLVTDLAVTGNTNTGHANSQAIDLGAPVAQNKSCRWSGFSLAAQIVKVTLKFDWAIPSGGADTDTSGGGSAAADASFDVTVSTNGGSTFPTNALSRSCSISGSDDVSLIESGSVAFDITPPPQDISQIQVRDRLHANATRGGGSPPASAVASVTVNISNLRLEVQTSDNAFMLVGM